MADSFSGTDDWELKTDNSEQERESDYDCEAES